ncbi:hypothetical protein FRC03_004200 [Tulasnella sp. 419]|nr:hypothetical protein FRC03_004200 [Tulasnella sp. 419]
MTSLDPSHIPNPFAKSKHTQWGAATHEVEVGHPSHRRRSSSFGSSIAPTSPPRPHFKLPVPDLRFEQSYLLSIKPFIQDVEEDEHAAEVDLTADENERTSKALAKDAGVVQGGRPGLPVQLDWIGIVWVTIRDQVSLLLLYPGDNAQGQLCRWYPH